ncbi:MAG: Dyp-type peroxidase [Gemmatimonadota bacterium]|nr:MAG: Dyp-type peroxidase [Gemmatimonadota bacterium]
MLTPDQAFKLSGSRKAVALSRRFRDGDLEDIALRYAQVGIPFVSEHSAYLTVHFKSPEALSFSRMKHLAADLHASAEESDFMWVAVTGVSFDQWRRWSEENAIPLDDALFEGREVLHQVLADHQPPYALDGGELFFQIKSLQEDKTKEIADRVMAELGDAIDEEKTNCTIGDSLHSGRIYGGRMLHGLISSVDPVGFSARAIVGDEFPQHKGGCFCLTQRFIHDWQQLLGMADSELENLIGRDHGGNIIVNDDERAHVKLVRVNDPDGVNYRLVGQSQPFHRYMKLVRHNGEDGVKYRVEEESPPDRSAKIGPGKELGIYQISYAKSIMTFVEVLQNMIGDEKHYIKCRHLNVSHADLGNHWYVPSALELELPAPHRTLTVLMNEFFNIRSENGLMFYNTKDYLYRVGNRAIDLKPHPTDRVIELLGYTFSRWHDTWYRRRAAPELGHLKDYLDEKDQHLLKVSVAERKGLAVKKTLELLSSEEPGRRFGTYRIHPKEIIVGVVPDYTLGSGYEVMHYLQEDERTEAFVMKLSEGGAAGHNVPNYHRLLEKGIGGLLDEAERLRANASDTEVEQFFQSVIYSLEGVQTYMRNYAALVRGILSGMRYGSQHDRENLKSIAQRMEKLANESPTTFVEAAQLVFSMHCCMHIAGESVSIGRLDQLLAPFYEADRITPDEAQEIIDCFWIKMDEQVLLNHRHFNDRLSRGSVAITYEGGDFPQGAALNQWVQQITVGGCKANDAETPEDGCNAVTRMCLRAARRLPLNAPCLSLRVHPDTPDDVLEEAARCVLSGGGHPFLINDDKIIAGLLRSGEGIIETGTVVDLADARDMVCDGCFETIMAGKNEFAFSFVPVPDAIEMALNRGRTYAAAGPIHITGLKASFHSKPAEEIDSWEAFYELFLEHYRYKLIDFYNGMLSRYGNLSKVCPSPLLSALIDDCLERSRDLTAGGARYKLLSPLMSGIATAIDSLWAIRHMVFSNEAVFTLPELVNCLICNWGYDMKEPFYSSTIGEGRIAVQAERFKHLRNYALGLSKFGQGHEEVDRFARKVVRDLVDMAYDLIRNPKNPISEKLEILRGRYGTDECPFEFVITPGIATFEDYAGVGSFLGASADGRRNGQTVASDFSPSSTPLDLPVPARGRVAIKSLHSWAEGKTAYDDPAHTDPIGVGLSCGSPVDINIRENFPLEQLKELIRQFAEGKIGPNMMSISCADPSTLEEAQRFPERYDLVRMRMGGWSEFFVAMFPHHQEQHKRRPVFEAAGDPEHVTAEVQTAWRGLVRRGVDDESGRQKKLDC